MDIRQKLDQYINTITENLSAVLLENMTVWEYLRTSNMHMSGTWATQVEIFVLAHFLQTGIWINTKG